MTDLVLWIQGLFDDFSVRAPFGIGWELDRADPPLTATVTPADCRPPTSLFVETTWASASASPTGFECSLTSNSIVLFPVPEPPLWLNSGPCR